MLCLKFRVVGTQFSEGDQLPRLTGCLLNSSSLEQDLTEWTSDKEVGRIEIEERREVYEKAKMRARKLIRESECCYYTSDEEWGAG